MQTRSALRHRARRVPCRAEVSVLRSAGPAVPGELRDVSLLGGRLAGVAGLTRGEGLRIGIVGRWRDARVCWSRGPLAGLLFDHLLSDRELRALAGPAGRALGGTPSVAGHVARPHPIAARPAMPGHAPLRTGKPAHAAGAEAAVLRLLPDPAAAPGLRRRDGWSCLDLRRTG